MRNYEGDPFAYRRSDPTEITLEIHSALLVNRLGYVSSCAVSPIKISVLTSRGKLY